VFTQAQWAKNRGRSLTAWFHAADRTLAEHQAIFDALAARPRPSSTSAPPSGGCATTSGTPTSVREGWRQAPCFILFSLLNPLILHVSV
jgi:hypothetical protein